jgi:hypothetical protein
MDSQSLSLSSFRSDWVLKREMRDEGPSKKPHAFLTLPFSLLDVGLKISASPSTSQPGMAAPASLEPPVIPAW